jgi:hypothetical protein
LNFFLPTELATIGVTVANAWNGAQSNGSQHRPRYPRRNQAPPVSQACQCNLKSIDKTARGKLMLAPSLKDNIAYVGSAPSIEGSQSIRIRFSG